MIEPARPDRPPASRTHRFRAEVLLTGAIVLAVTAAVALIPGVRFAYRSPDLHVVLLTAEALIGLLAAYLALERFRRQRRLDSLVLCLALTLLALPNLLFAALPVIVAKDTTVFSTWSALIGRSLGSVVFAAAAYTAASRVRRRFSSHARVGLVLGPLLLLGAVALGVAAFEGSLPRAIPAEKDPADLPGTVLIKGHWAVHVIQLVGLGVFTVAAVGFVRRAELTGDDLFRWLAVAAVLGAAARLNYFLYPSTFTDWVYTGDLFRLLFYVVILIAALREIHGYSRNVERVAALEERGSIARDLHDGLAQELASISRNLHWLPADDPHVARARGSADRALLQARRAITALAEQLPERADVALAEVARSVAEREGTRVALQLDRDVDLDRSEREAFVLIAAEAITNAARHGEAELVWVELTEGRRTRLTIRDHGPGFDPAAVDMTSRRRFGLESMRARAEAIGADFQVSALPGQGTEVVVTL
jgi:signal transduction histidine kinase